MDIAQHRSIIFTFEGFESVEHAFCAGFDDRVAEILHLHDAHAESGIHADHATADAECDHRVRSLVFAGF